MGGGMQDTDTVLSVAVTPDGSRVVSGSYDTTIKIWSLSSGALLNTLQASDRRPVYVWRIYLQ